jgi:hypothetical protein
MKATSFKQFTTTLMLITTMSFSSVLYAEEVALPVISKPAILQEGTQRELTAAQVAELLPWAKDSKIFLNDLLTHIQSLSSADKVDRLIEGIKTVVGESAPKNSELLMRYSLNRALVLNEILTKQMGADEVGTIDVQIRVLTLSIKLAMKYYETDMLTLSKKSVTPFVVFGLDYFSFLTELNKSVFDASAQYSIQRTSLEWLQWDLYRDLNNTAFAPQIVKINNSLKIFPSKKLTDAQSISYIRQMKAVSQELKVQETLKKVENDLRLVQATNEAEREKIREEQDRIQREKDEQEQIKKTGPYINATQTFGQPALNGVLFSSESDINGVCKALGYQKAANLTKDNDPTSRGTLIVVDENGKIIRGEYADKSQGFGLKQVTCLNKVIGYKAAENVEKISDLKISGVLVSTSSNENGVCQVLGYERGVLKSGVPDSTARGVMLVIDNNGNPVKGEAATNTTGFNISELVCINKQSQQRISFVKVPNPTVQGKVLSSNSNATGTCKLLGYKKGVDSSGDLDPSYRGEMLVVDVMGEIVGTETATSSTGFSLSSIVCIK